MIRTREELEDVVRCGRGFLYNDFGGSNPRMCPLHAIQCTWVDRMLAVNPGYLSVKKVWSESLQELLSWLREAGKPFSSCSFCNPTTATSTGVRGSHRSSATRHSTAPGSQDACFFVSARPDDQTVELWSESRLGFGKLGMRDMREQLREGIRRLRPSVPSHCHALYVSSDTSFCDTENVLIYNVDDSGGCFRSPPPIRAVLRTVVRGSATTDGISWIRTAALSQV